MSKFEEELETLSKDELKNYCRTLHNDCKFYRSIWKTHSNSAVYNLKVKTVNKKPVWVDPIADSYEYIKSLDIDEEVEEWLKPIKASR